MSNKKEKLKLWRYCCSNCGNKDKNIERAYEKPISVKLCYRCGHVMSPKETSITLNNKQKLTIKL
jgi:Zn ribbon nucleic-acid-binding protein